MKHRNMLTVFIIVASSVGTGSAFAAATPIDLRTWEQRGNLGSGLWNVSADGASVTQTINGGPTFFVSPTDSLNRTFNGSFSVSDSDDDFIGFVFGFTEPDADKNQFDFILFDWRRNQQVEEVTDIPAQEGFTLSRVRGFVEDILPDETGTEGYWSHTHPSMTVLDSNYASDLGWGNGAVYDFTLQYQSDRIEIDIDGATIFDISGDNYPSGSFGFYNFSQPNVTYQGFTETVVPLPPAIWLFGTALLSIFGMARINRSS